VINGPIALTNYGTIINCINNSNIRDHTGNRIAGIVIDNYGLVKNCINTGSPFVSGRIAGIVHANFENGIIDGCINLGTLSYNQ